MDLDLCIHADISEIAYSDLLAHLTTGIAARQTTFHLYNWGVPLVLTLLPAATLSYGNTGGWCWIKNTRAGGFWRFFQLYLPLWFVMGYNIDTVLSVRKKAMAVQNSLSSEGMCDLPRAHPSVAALRRTHTHTNLTFYHDALTRNCVARHVVLFPVNSRGLLDSRVYFTI